MKHKARHFLGPGRESKEEAMFQRGGDFAIKRVQNDEHYLPAKQKGEHGAFLWEKTVNFDLRVLKQQGTLDNSN